MSQAQVEPSIHLAIDAEVDINLDRTAESRLQLVVETGLNLAWILVWMAG